MAAKKTAKMAKTKAEKTAVGRIKTQVAKGKSKAGVAQSARLPSLTAGQKRGQKVRIANAKKMSTKRLAKKANGGAGRSH